MLVQQVSKAVMLDLNVKKCSVFDRLYKSSHLCQQPFCFASSVSIHSTRIYVDLSAGTGHKTGGRFIIFLTGRL